MKEIRSSDGNFLLVLDKHDDLLGELESFLEREKIRASRLMAIGAFRRAVIAYYRREKQDYDRIPIEEQVELTSLLGNSAVDADGKTKIHVHVNLGKSDGSVVGGHLMEAEVWPTCELVVEPLDAEVVRRMDEETQLPLISKES
ncbi:MAG: PPC domain-containing DNA-binding protein [Thermoanaerobaculia bacterium]|nr:PPC domain-containing DNA-binding protein [Thermoanaerobaculia bacterium]